MPVAVNIKLKLPPSPTAAGGPGPVGHAQPAAVPPSHSCVLLVTLAVPYAAMASGAESTEGVHRY